MKRKAAIRCLRCFVVPCNDRGTAMLFVVVLAVICSLVVGAASFSSRYTVKKSGARRVQVSAFNIADAGKEQILAKLRSREINPQPSQTATIYTNEPLGPGMYSVWYRTNAANDSITIFSTGKCQGDSVQIEVVATMAPDAWRQWVRGAVTARIPVDAKGDIEIDGRDHDTTGDTGKVLSTGGIFAVSTAGTVTPGGSSTFGGNGVAPQGTKIVGTTVQENLDTTGFPQTPEQVLGVPAGSLDKYKTSTCPPDGFFGIVYMDKGCDFRGGGIFICHNASGTASLDNFHANFKGLIIADEDKHFNGGTTVLGAVFMLGKAAGGNCFGNGNAKIHYSAQMLNRAMQVLGSSRRTVTVVSFRELKQQ